MKKEETNLFQKSGNPNPRNQEPEDRGIRMEVGETNLFKKSGNPNPNNQDEKRGNKPLSKIWESKPQESGIEEQTFVWLGMLSDRNRTTKTRNSGCGTRGTFWSLSGNSGSSRNTTLVEILPGVEAMVIR